MVQDLIQKGNIDLASLKFRVLDEVDEMLRIGFVEDVEFILGIHSYQSVCCLVFSVSYHS